MKEPGLIARKTLPIEELLARYKAKRRADDAGGNPLRHIEARKKLHPLMRLVLRADQLFAKETITVLADAHQETEGPVIYACTHIGGKDVERSYQILPRQVWMMLSNIGVIYRTVTYDLLKINGVITLDSYDPEDRHIAYRRAVELLKNDGNLLIFPEGAWNVTPHLPVMQLFDGTVRMALETGAAIVPVGCAQYGKEIIFNIGETLIPSKRKETDTAVLNRILRDALATLVWEIYVSRPQESRAQLPADALSRYHAEMMDHADPSYDLHLEDAYREAYHDKTVTSPEEAFAFLDRLIPSHNNAFLFRRG